MEITIEPHQIIISNNSSCIIQFSYPNDNNLYLKGSLEVINEMPLSSHHQYYEKMEWKIPKLGLNFRRIIDHV